VRKLNGLFRHFLVPNRDFSAGFLQSIKPGSTEFLASAESFFPSGEPGGRAESTKDLCGFLFVELAKVVPIKGLNDDLLMRALL